MYDPGLFESINYVSRRDNGDFAEEFNDEIAQMSGRCLDIGSGPGDVVVDFILPKVNPEATIVCSDISEPMMKFGREKYKDNHRLSFVKLDIESTDLPQDMKEQFDHVTSCFCLHWCRDMRYIVLSVNDESWTVGSFWVDGFGPPRQAFGNIFNLLRPGGTTFLTFFSNYPGSNAYTDLAAMPRYKPYLKDADRYIPVYQYSKRPREAIMEVIKEVGFELHHCSVREKSYTFENPDILRKITLAINPFIDRIPADLREAYERDLFEGVVKQNITFNKNGDDVDQYNIIMIYKLFVIYLKKPSTKRF